MSARLPSSSLRNPSPALLAAVGFVVFTASWSVLHHGWFARGQIVDTPVYQEYGWRIAGGDVPYRDFGLEYPPGALPAFALPAIRTTGDSDAFRQRFETLMFVCGTAVLLATALSLAALRAPPGRAWPAIVLAGISPLLLGSVVLTRFDLWPSALAAGALALALRGRMRLAHALLAVAVAAKVWPAVLAPLFLAYVWRRRGRREALVCGAVLVGAFAPFVLPFLALAPAGVWDSVVRQATRPLQLESVGAALVVVSHVLFGTGAHMVSSYGSQNLGGGVADGVAALQSLAQVAALLALWFGFARRDRDREQLAQWSAAAVLAFVALGKVLSPQYLIWLIPFVVLVRRRAAWVLFALALALTQAWFPQHYWGYSLHFSTPVALLVLTRDLVLLALLGLLVAPERPPAHVFADREPAPERAGAELLDTHAHGLDRARTP